jgi:hypothetical protein
MHQSDIGIEISVVKGRLHHPAMLHMDRFLVGEKPFAEDLPHSGESDTFDEVMLLGDGDLVRSLRGEDSDEESTGEEEGGDISMTLLHSLQELRCIDHECEGEQVSKRGIGSWWEVEGACFAPGDRSWNLAILSGTRRVEDRSTR